MKIWRWLLVLPLSFAAVTANAQTIGDGTTTLRNALIKQQRYMRGFSADLETHWAWKNGALVENEPKVHILSAMVAKSVKVSSSKVEITADRYAVFRDKNAKLSLINLDETARIIVDLTGADIATVLPHLADDLFYRNVNEALAALPSAYKNAVPPFLDPKDKPKAVPPTAGCDCADANAKKCGDPEDSISITGAKPPKVIYSVDPKFSETARTKKFNGGVQTGIDVDEAGAVSNVWIVRPTALGLDQSATDAIRQYRFAPATCHGQPVATHIFIDVNFQIF